MSTASITEEQAAAVDEITKRMSEMANLQEQIHSLGNQTSESIFALSKEMMRFRNDIIHNNPVHLTSTALLQLSKTDHLLWKWRVYNMILGRIIIRRSSLPPRLPFRKMVLYK
ncbi:hypothetical protein [Ureibacillus sp. FSL W8-0352]|uniref:hypothetical protein n=1 Tax=Ureibacillus sp. FSL W8-0352 TaxID=2954596 RepID=UPI0030F4F59C